MQHRGGCHTRHDRLAGSETGPYFPTWHRKHGYDDPYGGQEHVVSENWYIVGLSTCSFLLSLIIGLQGLEILDWPPCDRMADPTSPSMRSF